MSGQTGVTVDRAPAAGGAGAAGEADTRVIRVGVIGYGYWGPNLVRNFFTCPSTAVVALCDQSPDRLQAFKRLYPGPEITQEYDSIIENPDVDAVVIATPVGTHAPLALRALRAGKHVLVEKPMAASAMEAEELAREVEKSGLVLMVDHTFVYSPPVQRIKQLVDAGELGDLYYFDSVRINLGLFQHDVNVLWDLAPHDLSIVDYLMGCLPKSMSAFGACHAGRDRELEDVAYLNLDFGGGVLASFHVNWLSPVKVRHLIVGGSRKSIVYNDLEPAEKIKVYDRGVTVSSDPEARRKVLINYRTGDVWSPHIEQTEPLQNVVRHFADCIRHGRKPLTGVDAGLRVVRILEAAQRSIKAQGGRITL
jgi:predicted dehydrogenase